MKRDPANSLQVPTKSKNAPRWQRKLTKLLTNPARFLGDAKFFPSIPWWRKPESPSIGAVAELMSPLLPLREVPISRVVGSLEQLDPESYLAANPDVRRAKADPRQHFEQHGRREARTQYALAEIQEARAQKMARIRFNRRPVQMGPLGMPQNYLGKSVMESFEIPEEPPIAQNDYNPEIVELIRANPDKLFLDVGAGLRHTCYSNVVNAEVWPSISTDVVCVGEDLPFSSAQFDFVLCLAVLEHTKRPWMAVQEILRVLKPGGMVRIDWPFLQPVHGYPHHYFNATPKGLVSQFEDACEIVSAEVRQWQHPMYAITWIMQEWRSGLPEMLRASLDSMTVGDFLGASIHDLVGRPISTELSRDVQQVIAAGTTLIARKRSGPMASTET